MLKKQSSKSAKTKSAKNTSQKKTFKAKTDKNNLLDKYRGHEKDTGSTEVQIVLLTKRIKELSAHLKEHPKDFDSKRGLLIMLGKRRRLLNYLDKIDQEGERYPKLIQDLGLRR